MNKNLETLKENGAEVKHDKNGQLIIRFSSQQLSDSQLLLLRELTEKCLVAFYGCDFSNCDLNILKDSTLMQIAIIYSNFTDENLREIVQNKSLRLLKLFDTKVSEGLVKQISSEMGELKIV